MNSYPLQKKWRWQIYIKGNSLRLQPKRAKDFINQELKDWEKFGVEGHFINKTHGCHTMNF